jgi:hypothetical protein
MGEKYSPSPEEIRKAEETMDERQRELTETREDSLHEGRLQGKDTSEIEATETTEFPGITKEDFEKFMEYSGENLRELEDIQKIKEEMKDPKNQENLPYLAALLEKKRQEVADKISATLRHLT